jgi:soluble lytic murein transglycosylase
MLFKRALRLLLASSILAAPALAANPDHDAQGDRERFRQAEQALSRGDSDAFRRLAAGLQSYPLHPYLEYEALRRRLSSAASREVEAFLKRNDDTPLAAMLRAAWLDQLAAQRRWKEYLAFYREDADIDRRCHHLQALIETGRAEQAFARMAPVWLHGKSRPKSCDPAIEAWSAAGHRSAGMIWRRIELAMDAGQLRLVRYLARDLSAAEREWVESWIRLHDSPQLAGDTARFAMAHPYREAMLGHAVQRLTRREPLAALDLWNRIVDSYPFSNEQRSEIEQLLVRYLARNEDPAAYGFMRRAALRPTDLKAHEARLRTALMYEDWIQVLDWIGALPDSERASDRWRYWQARAVDAFAGPEAAVPLYAAVAAERSYYGFLAADRLVLDYHLAHSETPVDDSLVEAVAQLPAVRRAAELFALDRPTEARREWRWATRGLDQLDLKAAAKLASRNGWHDRAIFTLAQTGYWDDLVLRFPVQHAELVAENAGRHGIDKAWIFAVMRQESAFMDNARSHAGALGLMQVMPATARHVARNLLNRKPPARREILQPDTNIALGSAYLSEVKAKLGDSAVLATAAYNAGPHRVAGWLPQRTLPADIWIELVPFEETRTYLRRVLTYTVIYEKRLGLTPTRLAQRLHPVPPTLELLLGEAGAAADDDSAG